MLLRKIYDSDTIQGYKIVKPTAAFKKKYPKNYIIIFLNKDRKIIKENVDKIPLYIAYYKLPGYVFSYNTIDLSLYDYSNNDDDINAKYHMVPKIFSFADLFDDNTNFIITFIPRYISEPTFIEPSIHCFKLNIDKLIDKEIDKLTDNWLYDILSKSFYEYYKNRKPNSIEDFIDRLELFNIYDLPIRFPDTITDKDFDKKLDMKKISVLYDTRFDTIEQEFAIAKLLDDIYIPDNLTFKIYDDYSDLANIFSKKLNKKKKKSKNNNKVEYLEITYKELKNIKYKYPLISCF